MCMVRGRDIPVSYTHLDVYKRQTNPLANGTETYYASPTGAKLAKHIHERLVGLGLKDRGIKQGTYAVLRNTRMPVSYTHLDVYKRQLKDICGLLNHK